MIVHGTDGSQSTGSQTGYRLHSKEHILCGRRFCGYLQFFAEFLQDRNGFTYMTCRSVTNLDDVSSLRFQGEVLIKCCYYIDLSLTDSKIIRDIGEHLLGKIAVGFLDCLHNGNYR